MIRYLAINPNSYFWKNPASGTYETHGSLLDVGKYIQGMAGYAITLPRRILGVATAFLFLIGCLFYSLATWNSSHFKVGLIVFAGSVGEVFAGIIGIVCPYAAYQLDEWLYSHPEIYKYSLARWMEQRLGRDRIEPLMHYFKEAADCLKSVDGFASDGFMPVDMDVLVVTSLIFALANGEITAIGNFCSGADPPEPEAIPKVVSDAQMIADLSRESPAAICTHIAQDWETLLVQQGNNREALIARLVSRTNTEIRRVKKPHIDAMDPLGRFVHHMQILGFAFYTDPKYRALAARLSEMAYLGKKKLQ